MTAVQAAQPAASLKVSSASFNDGANIPSKFTCDGADLSPDLHFSSPPTATRSFAIVTDDPDAPAAFAHWLAYGIPASTQRLPEGASTPSQRLVHGNEGTNGFGHIGYGGPCPPAGKPHHYIFRVYALDVIPALPPGASMEQVNAALQGHVLAEGHITGLYARDGD
ncbi:YbhB/YbcL family Raf kinase inhibitor-like protein [Dyella monticola]|uniref:YbhB/YbcL family Raf kinase inhibitor-like protein n=2 Tax=Dyella monticola TaxID=1927958 RepID=A0A370WSR4_9GAMM|nr:YbhB/YbcL family Raf kinase inhibitor-like protein [Dyella monticola]